MVISAVVNTRNEENNIVRCLDSVKSWCDEIVVVDMNSTDETLSIANKYTDRIYQHEYVGYVEPARNFAISKADGDWVLVIDADEQVPTELATKLSRLAEQSIFDYYRLPRKNIIFGKWITHSGWWPDYQIRFFKKDKVSWSDEIHSIPITYGRGMDLPYNEKNALIHYHYINIEQYIERLNRYTTFEARQLMKDGVAFDWRRLIIRPANEFISRFFAWEGYQDGLHGLALSLLQAFSIFIVELKLWEYDKFMVVEHPQFADQVLKVIKKNHQDMIFWHFSKKVENTTSFKKFYYKIRSKVKI